jgi:hypothetical protein
MKHQFGVFTQTTFWPSVQRYFEQFGFGHHSVLHDRRNCNWGVVNWGQAVARSRKFRCTCKIRADVLGTKLQQVGCPEQMIRSPRYWNLNKRSKNTNLILFRSQFRITNEPLPKLISRPNTPNEQSWTQLLEATQLSVDQTLMKTNLYPIWSWLFNLQATNSLSRIKNDDTPSTSRERKPLAADYKYPAQVLSWLFIVFSYY